jgi:hypothetical protein
LTFPRMEPSISCKIGNVDSHLMETERLLQIMLWRIRTDSARSSATRCSVCNERGGRLTVVRLFRSPFMATHRHTLQPGSVLLPVALTSLVVTVVVATLIGLYAARTPPPIEASQGSVRAFVNSTGDSCHRASVAAGTNAYCGHVTTGAPKSSTSHGQVQRRAALSREPATPRILPSSPP